MRRRRCEEEEGEGRRRIRGRKRRNEKVEERKEEVEEEEKEGEKGRSVGLCCAQLQRGGEHRVTHDEGGGDGGVDGRLEVVEARAVEGVEVLQAEPVREGGLEARDPRREVLEAFCVQGRQVELEARGAQAFCVQGRQADLEARGVPERSLDLKGRHYEQRQSTRVSQEGNADRRRRTRPSTACGRASPERA